MTKTMSLKQARFTALVDKAARLSERVIVTKNGTPKAVVMGVEEFERWVETLELMSNPKAVKALEHGFKIPLGPPALTSLEKSSAPK